MPKVYLTLEERKRAEVDKLYRMENAYIGKEIQSAMKENKIRYCDMKNNAYTISKAKQEPQKMKIETLRDVCFAAGLRLVIDVKPI